MDNRKNVEFSGEQIKLMQTQDKRYIAARHVMESRKVERLHQTLQRLEEAPNNKHTFFVEDEKDLKRFSLSKRLDTPSALLSRRYNRPRTSDLEKTLLTKYVKDPQTIEACSKLRGKAYKELSRRMERQKKLCTLEKKMEIKKTLQVIIYFIQLLYVK